MPQIVRTETETAEPTDHDVLAIQEEFREETRWTYDEDSNVTSCIVTRTVFKSPS